MTTQSNTAAPAIITDEHIRALETRVKGYKFQLGGGLFLFVTPSGVKSFRLRYKGANGSDQTHTIGKFGKFTLDQARAVADQLRESLGLGNCIRTQQLEARDTALATLGDEFRAWFPIMSTKVGEAYARRTELLMGSDDLAPIMGKRLGALDMPQVLKFCRALEITRSPSFARETAHALEKVFEHARTEGRHRGDNPAHKVVEHLTPRDSQPWDALQLNQLPLYFQDLGGVPAARARTKAPRSTMKATTVLALRLLPYLTLRPSILRTARWEWISWDGEHGAMMVVPAFTTGTKQRRTEVRTDGKGKSYAPYRVPLSRQVVAMLRELQAMTGDGPFLFPGYKGRGHAAARPVSAGCWLGALRQLGWDGSTDERGAITVHGFRALFATAAYTRYVITRVDEHALEFQQDHKLTDGVRAHYTRDKQGSHRGLLIAERARLLQWWADEIDTTLGLAQGAKLPQSRVDMAAAFASRGMIGQSPHMMA